MVPPVDRSVIDDFFGSARDAALIESPGFAPGSAFASSNTSALLKMSRSFKGSLLQVDTGEPEVLWVRAGELPFATSEEVDAAAQQDSRIGDVLQALKACRTPQGSPSSPPQPCEWLPATHCMSHGEHEAACRVAERTVTDAVASRVTAPTLATPAIKGEGSGEGLQSRVPLRYGKGVLGTFAFSSCCGEALLAGVAGIFGWEFILIHMISIIKRTSKARPILTVRSNSHKRTANDIHGLKGAPVTQ